jgi:Na+/melibiose symporter-like transporter
MASVAVLSIAVYIGAVRGQNDLPQWWLLVLMVAIAIAAAASAALTKRRLVQVVLLPATVLAAVLGFLTLFSIGGPLVLTAALGLVALLTDSSPRRT